MKRFTFVTPTGTVTGPVRGAGGYIDNASILSGSVRLTKLGRPLHIYEPAPGCVAVFPDYSAAGDGDPVIVSLVDSTWTEAIE